jgi:hypothetical protein
MNVVHFNWAGIYPFDLHVTLPAEIAGAYPAGQIKYAVWQGPIGSTPPEHALRAIVFIFDHDLQVAAVASNGA